VVVFFAGGWKEKKGRKVETLQAPVTLTAGRYEYGLKSAEIVRIPKTKYEPASSKVVVSLDLKNMDTETKETESILGNLLQLVPADGSEFVKSSGAICQGQSNYRLVFELNTSDVKGLTLKLHTTQFFTGVPVRDLAVDLAIPSDEIAKQLEDSAADQYVQPQRLIRVAS
jgi:hypothetical protein